MSDVIAELIRQGLRRPEAVTTGARGLPELAVSRGITAEDVRSLDDEE